MSQMRTQHKIINRYLLTQGCVREQDLQKEYKQICDVYPENIQSRGNRAPLDRIIDDINRFMQFMNASIVPFSYELNDTKYYAYQLAVDTESSNDDLITKHSINLPLNQLKLFRKILDLALMNNGLITRKAISNLNNRSSQQAQNTNDMINDEQLHELLLFVCKRKYLYEISSINYDDDHESQPQSQANEEEDNYCIGPRTCVGLQTYIDQKRAGILPECPICNDLIIGYGFQCQFRDCTCCYHAKCVEAFKSSRQCANCQNKWKFDPTTRIGLLSNPAESENMVQRLLSQRDNDNNTNSNDNNRNRNRNVNRQRNDDNKSDDDDDDDMAKNIHKISICKRAV